MLSLTGDIEWIINIPPNVNLKLKEYLFPEHLPYVELVYYPGSNNATVRAVKPLDVDIIEVFFSLHVKTSYKGFIDRGTKVALCHDF